MVHPDAHHLALLCSIALVALIPLSCPYPTGMPDEAEACSTLQPSTKQHAVPVDPGPPPFKLDIISHTTGQSWFDLLAGWFKFQTSSSEATVHVELRRIDGRSFRGFVIQAREVQTQKPIGNFHINSSLYAQETCASSGGGTITHINNNPKYTINVPWTPPQGFSGDLQFYATAVEKNDQMDESAGSVYWTNLTSKPFNVKSNPEGPTQVIIYEGANSTVDLSLCGHSWGCFKYPEYCRTVKDCRVIVAWKPRGEFVDFKMFAYVGSDNQWLALGLSNDKHMGLDSVTDCTYDLSQPLLIRSSWNEDKSSGNQPLSNPNLGLVTEKSLGLYEDGMLQCNFTRHMTVNSSDDVGGNSKVYDLKDRPYYLLVAMGPAEGGGIRKHIRQPLVSYHMVDLSKDLVLVKHKGEEHHKEGLIKAHGSLMVFAWVLFTSIGVLLPRYYKFDWTSSVTCGKPSWFMTHMCLMISGLTFTIIAIILIFVQAGGYSSGSKPAHGIVGLIVMSLAIINPIIAAIRPAPNTKRRPLFNMIHFSVGRLAHIMAVCNVILGLRQDLVGADRWALWLMVAFINVHIITEVVLSLLRSADKRKSKYRTSQNPEATTRYNPKAALIRNIIYVVYVCITVGVTIALVVNIVMRVDIPQPEPT